MTAGRRALSRAPHRLRATAVLESARPVVGTDAFTLVEAVETVCAALLRSSGVNDDAARAVLAALWDQPPGTADAFIPPRTPRRAEHERRYARDLGQRLHLIRRARRRSSHDLCRILDVSPIDLHELEQAPPLRPRCCCTGSLAPCRSRCRCWSTRPPHRRRCCACSPAATPSPGRSARTGAVRRRCGCPAGCPLRLRVRRLAAAAQPALTAAGGPVRSAPPRRFPICPRRAVAGLSALRLGGTGPRKASTQPPAAARNPGAPDRAGQASLRSVATAIPPGTG